VLTEKLVGLTAPTTSGSPAEAANVYSMDRRRLIREAMTTRIVKVTVIAAESKQY